MTPSAPTYAMLSYRCYDTVSMPVQRIHTHTRCVRRSARDFDLGGGFQRTQVITLWCFYIVGREILTLGEGFNTQVITLWCFYIVGREILTLGEGCFYIVPLRTHRYDTRCWMYATTWLFSPRGAEPCGERGRSATLISC
jgi:hypothetical protein